MPDPTDTAPPQDHDEPTATAAGRKFRTRKQADDFLRDKGKPARLPTPFGVGVCYVCGRSRRLWRVLNPDKSSASLCSDDLYRAIRAATDA